jgi:hypothetical protein
LPFSLFLCLFQLLSHFSTDESLTSSYNNLLTAPSNYHQPLQTSSIGSVQGTGLISTSLSLPQGMTGNFYQQPGSSGMAQSLSTQPLEQYNDEFYPSSTAGIDEQYIYVTYPSELKKRLSDRYGDRETLLVLTNDEHF